MNIDWISGLLNNSSAIVEVKCSKAHVPVNQIISFEFLRHSAEALKKGIFDAGE